MKQNNDQYDFGENWTNFLNNSYDSSRLENARQSLQNFLGVKTLKGKTFLDVGCGSGLFSLAAHTLEAEKVLSFDVNPKSVQCCEKLRSTVPNSENWEVREGSILDEGFVSQLGQHDIVYAWGVLHHTGKMWRAIENTFGLVKDGGKFYLAIYNKADGFAVYPDGRFGSSKFWQVEKKFYTSLPKVFQSAVDSLAAAAYVTSHVAIGRNPYKKMKDHKDARRGMEWMTDLRDWLGGYPYEYATAEEIFAFAKPHGFLLENLKTNNGLLNNEFLLAKKKKS